MKVRTFFRDILIGGLSMAIAIVLAYLILTFLFSKTLNDSFFDLQPMVKELLDKTSGIENEVEDFKWNRIGWKKGEIKEILIAEMTNYDTAGNYYLATKTKDDKPILYKVGDFQRGIYKYNPNIKEIKCLIKQIN